MKFEDKLFRGKTILSPDTDEEHDQYNVIHIIVGSMLMIILPLVIYFLSGKNLTMLLVSQYIASAVVGLIIGFWAGCVPSITIIVIILSSTGKLLYRLFSGNLGAFGSTEFNVRLLAWTAIVIVIVGFTYLGAKLKHIYHKKQ